MNTLTHRMPSLQAEVPDLALLQQSKKSCNDQMIEIEVAHAQTAYLPSLYRKFNDFNSMLNQGHTKLRDGAQKLHYALLSRCKVLKGYLDELTSAYNEEERQEILGDIAKELKATQRDIRTQTSSLAGVLLALSDPFDRTPTLNNLAGFSVEKERMPAEVTQIEASIEKVEAERTTVTAAINAIESKGFSVIAQDTFLNAEKIAALGVAPPQLAVIEVAMDLLKQSLANMEAGMNFLGLIKLRERLRERSNELSCTLRSKYAELVTLNRRIKMIESVHTLDDQRQIYNREYGKIVTMLQAYEAGYNRVTPVEEEPVREFIVSVTELAAYLQPIR